MQSIDILRCSMANEPETIVKLQRLQVQQRPIIYWDRCLSSGFWDQWRPKLRESLAHLVGFIMRRAVL